MKKQIKLLSLLGIAGLSGAITVGSVFNNKATAGAYTPSLHTVTFDYWNCEKYTESAVTPNTIGATSNTGVNFSITTGMDDTFLQEPGALASIYEGDSYYLYSSTTSEGFVTGHIQSVVVNYQIFEEPATGSPYSILEFHASPYYTSDADEEIFYIESGKEYVPENASTKNIQSIYIGFFGGYIFNINSIVITYLC